MLIVDKQYFYGRQADQQLLDRRNVTAICMLTMFLNVKQYNEIWKWKTGNRGLN